MGCYPMFEDERSHNTKLASQLAGFDFNKKFMAILERKDKTKNLVIQTSYGHSLNENFT